MKGGRDVYSAHSSMCKLLGTSRSCWPR